MLLNKIMLLKYYFRMQYFNSCIGNKLVIVDLHFRDYARR